MTFCKVVRVTYHLEMRNDICYVVLTCRDCGKRVHEIEIPRVFPSSAHNCLADAQEKAMLAPVWNGGRDVA